MEEQQKDDINVATMEEQQKREFDGVLAELLSMRSEKADSKASFERVLKQLLAEREEVVILCERDSERKEMARMMQLQQQKHDEAAQRQHELVSSLVEQQKQQHAVVQQLLVQQQHQQQRQLYLYREPSEHSSTSRHVSQDPTSVPNGLENNNSSINSIDNKNDNNDIPTAAAETMQIKTFSLRSSSANARRPSSSRPH